MAKALGGAVTLSTRGGLERTCRAWRRLALQLPTTLHIDLCDLHEEHLDEEATLAALQAVLPSLQQRNVRSFSVIGCTTALSPLALGLLARTFYPQLRRLQLRGSSLLLFTSFLSHCTQLEDLWLTVSELQGQSTELLLCHLSALPGKLQQLDLLLGAPHPDLMQLVGRQMQPAQLKVTTSAVHTSLFQPQLRDCTVTITDGLSLQLFASGLTQHGPRHGLRSLTLNDQRQAAAVRALTQLPGLELLPELLELDAMRSVPQQAWLCTKLTSMTCLSAHISPSLGPSQCSSLRRLTRQGCSFRGDAFPAELCTLAQLTALEIFGDNLGRGCTALPDQFSQLRALRHLTIFGARLDKASMAALRPLAALTGLDLTACEAEHFFGGAYILGLRILDLSCEGLPQPVPFHATAAQQLEKLRIVCSSETKTTEGWLDLQTKLNCFPRLKLLCLDGHEEDELEAVAELVRSYFGFKVVCGGLLSGMGCQQCLTCALAPTTED